MLWRVSSGPDHRPTGGNPERPGYFGAFGLGGLRSLSDDLKVGIGTGFAAMKEGWRVKGCLAVEARGEWLRRMVYHDPNTGPRPPGTKWTQKSVYTGVRLDGWAGVGTTVLAGIGVLTIGHLMVGD